jgi:ankyrin repeat protein
MKVMMENSRKFVFAKRFLRKCFLTLIVSAAVSILPVQNGFSAAAPSVPAACSFCCFFSLIRNLFLRSSWPTSEKFEMALRRRALVVLFSLDSSLGSNSCKDVNRRCLEFHLQQVCMPDEIICNFLGQPRFMSFNVEDLSAALGQSVKLPVGADQALSQASTEGQTELAVFSLAAGADVGVADNDGNTSLHYAALFGHMQICDLLIRHKASVGVAANDGDTPLHSAALFGHVQVCDLLIRCSANVGATNNYGNTPLPYAALFGHVQVCDLLIRHRANAGTTDNDGNTPLHWAAREGCEQICNLLIRHRANASAANNNGNTPLHLAAMEGRAQVCTFLLVAGADLSFLNNSSETSAMVARNYNYLNLARILEEEEAVASVVPGSVD